MDNESKRLLEDTVGLLSLVFLVTSIVAFVYGACEATPPTNGCEYQSIVAYHPARILACELFKQRW
jgi:hypothetical protein